MDPWLTSRMTLSEVVDALEWSVDGDTGIPVLSEEPAASGLAL